MIFIAGVMFAITNREGVTQNPIALIGVLLFGLLLIFSSRFSVSRAYKADKRLQQEYSASIGEEGIEVQSETAKTEYSWRSFIQFMETKNLFVLYQAPRLYNTLPKRSFGPGEADAFRELAKRKVVSVPQKQPNVVKTIVFWLVIALSAILLWQVVKFTR